MAATRAVSVSRIFLPDNGKPCQLILCEVLCCNDQERCFQKLHLNYGSGGEVHLLGGIIMNEFVKISVPKIVYHYTTKADAESIIVDGKIYPADGSERWYSLTLDVLKTYIDLTIKNEGQAYIDSNRKIKTYGKFVPENYVILELKPRYSDHWY